MSSEQLPAPRLTQLDRTRRENRPDFPVGLSTSFFVHAALIMVGFTLAALFYVATKEPAPESAQRSTIITIETLVRDPQVVTRQPVEKQTISHVAVTQTQPVQPAVSHASGHTALAANQLSIDKIQPGAPSTILGGENNARHSVAKKRKASDEVSKPGPGPQVAHAPAVPGQSSNGITTATQGNGNQDPGSDSTDGVTLSPGGAAPWSERLPSGPFGGPGGHDDCTPSRGGFFLGHHH
jgi:hypothetical protein